MTSSTVKALAAAAAIAAVAGLASCTPKPAVQCDFTPLLGQQQIMSPAMVGQTPGTIQPVALNTVSVIDENIRRKVLVQAVNATRTQTGDVMVETRLMNCTDHPLQVDGRTHFMTAGGMQAEQPSMWQRVYLPPRSFGSYGETSVAGNRVETFLIEVKEAR